MEEILCSIRKCEDCKILNRFTPCVFGSAQSRILVVSDSPPRTEYTGTASRPPLGVVMARGTLEGRWTPAFARERWRNEDWLDISKQFNSRNFFWIHRANCAEELGGNREHCTSKFMENAISLIKPTLSLILIFGRYAAGYFFPNRDFLELVRRRDLVDSKHGLKCCVLYHWSPRNKQRNLHQEDHDMALKDAKKIVHEILSLKHQAGARTNADD